MRSVFPHQLETLGDHLRKHRLELGLDQDAAARMIGVTDGSLRAWELNTARPKVEHRPAILCFLGYDPFPPDDSLAARLLHFRQSHGIPRAAFARFLGIDDTTLCRWEQGKLTRKKHLKERLQVLLASLENGEEKDGILKKLLGEDGEQDATLFSSYLPAVSLGEHLIERRREMNLSQEDLATRLRVSRTRVYDWETDSRLPDHLTMPSVVEFLGFLPLPSQPANQLAVWRRALGLSARSVKQEFGLKRTELRLMEAGKVPVATALLARIKVSVEAEFPADRYPRLHLHPGGISANG